MRVIRDPQIHTARQQFNAGVFIGGYDMPINKGSTGQVLVTDGAGRAIWTTVPGVSTTFLALTDTPASYTGQANKIVAVKADESGLEFIAPVATDELLKVSLNDSTAGYLNGKLVSGTGISLTENNDGGNETLTVASTITQYTNEMAQDAVGSAVGNGLDYDDPSGAISVDESELSHNSIGGLQGGTTNEYYHLTAAEHTALASYITAETDPVFSAWLATPPDLSEFNNDLGFITDLSTFTTTDLTEGTNLYFTDERAQDAVGNSVGNGLDYDDITGAISVDESELTHNSLGGLNSGDYIHLTAAEYAALHAAVTVTDSDSINFTLTGQDITADLVIQDTTSVDLAIDGSGLKATVLPAGVDHNSLGGLQGGTTGEYYHLTSAEYSALIGGSGATDKVAFWSDGDTLTYDSLFGWDSTNHRMGLGIAPSSSLPRLTIAGDNSSDGSQLFYTASSAADNATSLLSFLRAGGTTSSASNALTSNWLGGLMFFGRGATDFGAPSAIFIAQATQDFTDSAHGTQMSLLTTPNNSTSTAAAQVWSQNQSIDFYNTVRTTKTTNGALVHTNTNASTGTAAYAGYSMANSVATGRIMLPSTGYTTIAALANQVVLFGDAATSGMALYSQSTNPTDVYVNSLKQLSVASTGLTIGSGAAGVDYTLTIHGESHDLVLQGLEDEDHFLFQDKVYIGAKPSQNNYSFGDSLTNDPLYLYTTTSNQGFKIEVQNMTPGPLVDWWLNSPSPAVFDEVGRLRFISNDDGGDQFITGQIRVDVGDVRAAHKSGRILLQVENDNNLNVFMTVDGRPDVSMTHFDFPIGGLDRDFYFQTKRFTEGDGTQAILRAADGLDGIGTNKNGGSVWVHGGAKTGSGTDGDVYLAQVYGGSGRGYVFIGNIKSGATQGAAGAGANEIWKTASHATLPDNVLMIGT